ncbi:hypothetical protein [Actinophytocola sp.]|uniref:hypothetical protein n=1 Tax=Actinophytocola sp. TaxID=1872138 RepID=UPI00389B1A2D
MSDEDKSSWSAIDLNGTGVSMYPAPTAKNMADVADTDTGARDGWSKGKGAISSLEGKLGQGPMGGPFREQYNPAATQLTTAINNMVANLSQVSKAGTDAVPMYIQADLAAGYHFEF